MYVFVCVFVSLRLGRVFVLKSDAWMGEGGGYSRMRENMCTHMLSFMLPLSGSRDVATVIHFKGVSSLFFLLLTGILTMYSLFHEDGPILLVRTFAKMGFPSPRLSAPTQVDASPRLSASTEVTASPRRPPPPARPPNLPATSHI